MKLNRTSSLTNKKMRHHLMNRQSCGLKVVVGGVRNQAKSKVLIQEWSDFVKKKFSVNK